MSELPPGTGSDDALAAELSLGLLSGPERAEAARRRLADPAFARAVEAWDARLAALTEATPPVTPPDAVWRAVSEALGEDQEQDTRLVRLRRSVALWRTATMAAAGLAACLAVALAWPRRTPTLPPSPMLTARLSASAAGSTVFVALYDPARRALILTPASVQAAAGRSPELWLIPSYGKPLALGVGDFTHSVRLGSHLDLQGLTTGALAVSLEPSGGSPTGQPTGAVIATGQLSRL